MLSGIVIINKPTGVTSRFIVDKVGAKFKTRKVGHTGTLDPMATGVLIICINKATKLVDYLTTQDKTYQVTFELGYETDTLDATGKITKEQVCLKQREEIIAIIKSYQKTYNQEVPAYSAIKVNGKKLYEYARENKEVELPKREVTIKKISNIAFDNQEISFVCDVTKGTYIRSLIRDIGLACDSYATMTSLDRTSQGKYDINMATSVEDCEPLKVEDLFDNTKSISILEIAPIINGNVITYESNEPYIKITYNNELVAIYQLYKENTYKPLINFKQ